jgi:hypothetical protein
MGFADPTIGLGYGYVTSKMGAVRTVLRETYHEKTVFRESQTALGGQSRWYVALLSFSRSATAQQTQIIRSPRRRG